MELVTIGRGKVVHVARRIPEYRMLNGYKIPSYLVPACRKPGSTRNTGLAIGATEPTCAKCQKLR